MSNRMKSRTPYFTVSRPGKRIRRIPLATPHENTDVHNAAPGLTVTVELPSASASASASSVDIPLAEHDLQGNPTANTGKKKEVLKINKSIWVAGIARLHVADDVSCKPV